MQQNNSEYTVKRLADMAGVSSRTLRYYDDIGLLRPGRLSASGYRMYGPDEVDALQHILFLRELGLELEAISAILHDPGFDRAQALRRHLEELEGRRKRLDTLIQNVKNTIMSEEGAFIMPDKEKFEGFKKSLIEENEAKYGKGIREKYGNKTVDESNMKMLNMTEEQYQAMQAVSAEILSLLEAAVKSGTDPKSDDGKAVAALHKKWLGYAWKEYKPEAHVGLANMYVDDERFTKYYDTNVQGCAAFLKTAIETHVNNI